ncbi:MAG: glycoside hydrolase family 88 protein [Gammaproteobacteria bacterium]|nr:glycoside hydrolase family 88 protein [Gammaproteobacteria bacterium]
MNTIDKYIDYLVDNSKPESLIWNQEVIKEGKIAGWNYIDGCMMNSLLELYHITGNEKYFDFVKAYADYFIEEDGTIKRYDRLTFALDDICSSRILFEVYEKTGDEKYKKAIDYTYKQIEFQPRTKEGNFFHKLIYPYQVWMDGFYMVMPFYVQYINKYMNRDYTDILNMYKLCEKNMFDPKAKLFYHGYDESRLAFWADKKTGLSKSFWLRAEGWFLTSIVDIYPYILNIDTRAYFKDLFRKAIDGILKYLDKNTNMFYQVINEVGREGNYPETSGSSMLSYSILKAVRLGILDESYREVGIKVFNGIKDRYFKVKGNEIGLGGICLVAGLGPEKNRRRDGTYEYYISEPVVEDESKGIAPFIMAYLEIKRSENENRN